MKEMIYKELERSQHELFTQEEWTPILVSIKLSRSQADENIGIDYWMNVLNTYAEYGEDVTDHSDKLLEGMTVEDVRDVVWKFLKKVKVRDWVIKSEEADPLSDWEK